mmetsp:Transcript_116031/g.328834  ORF Transcript_116031/g.328834 Transcript_116031/m.328834 type:complete len:203 (-) Transcript_116031:106-714(-)
MPVRSGSSASRRNACDSRCSSKLRLIRAQSSNWNSLKRGSPPPMSITSSTPKTSRPSKSTFSSSSSRPSGSPIGSSSGFFSPPAAVASPCCSAAPAPFAAAAAAALAASPCSTPSAAFFAAAALYSFCLACQRFRTCCHSLHFPLNHSDGCRSSIRVVSFFFRVHCFRWALAFGSLLHSALTSSKPSSFVGKLNFAKLVFRT